VRWGALIIGFLRRAAGHQPGRRHVLDRDRCRARQCGAVGTVTVGVRGMTATETAETLTMYQMVVLTAVFALTLPFSWVAPTAADWGAMVVNGLGNGLGQYLWTRALHLAPTSRCAVQLLLAGVAIILGFLVWGDVPTAALLAGSAIVVGRACSCVARVARR